VAQTWCDRLNSYFLDWVPEITHEQVLNLLFIQQNWCIAVFSGCALATLLSLLITSSRAATGRHAHTVMTPPVDRPIRMSTSVATGLRFRRTSRLVGRRRKRSARSRNRIAKQLYACALTGLATSRSVDWHLHPPNSDIVCRALPVHIR